MFKKFQGVIKEISVMNLVPDVLVYKGHSNEPFFVEVYSYHSGHHRIDAYTNASDFLNAFKAYDPSAWVVWVNVIGLSHVEEIKKLGSFFDISSVMLEQILTISTHSYHQYNNDCVFNSLQMVYGSKDGLINENISIYKKDNCVFTFQEKVGDVFDALRDRIKAHEGHIRDENSDYLYYCIMDALTDYYLGACHMLREQLEDLEEAIINLERIDVSYIHRLRKMLMILRFSAEPVEKMIAVMRSDHSLLKLTNEHLMDSLHNHIHEVVLEVNLHKEYLESLFENHVLNNSNEMNKVMTTLTIFSAIFIPLSFAAGVFGMNFDKIPGLHQPMAFYFFILGCAVTAFSMLLFFKLKKWF